MAQRRVLLLGGTGWLGREIATAALDRGDSVTCLARGTADAPRGAQFVSADRTEPGAYDAVRDTEWDDIVELSFAPDLVSGALAALAARARHWTFISTVSVYARDDEPGADESAQLVDPDEDPTGYGNQKVAAERATAAALGDRLLIVRPGLIAGPGDPSDRFGYWVARFAHVASMPADEPLDQPGDVLVPTFDGLWSQAIDVRDLASFVVDAGARSLTGTVNAVGEALPLAHVVERSAFVAGFTGRLRGRSDAWLAEHGVDHWSGPSSLPLWLPRESAAFAQRSDAAYLALGGRRRPLEQTLLDSLADERARGLDRTRRAGLSRIAERALLDL